MRSSVLGLLGFLFFVSPSLAAAQPDSTLLRAVMVGDGVARVETAWTTSARGRRARVTARLGEGPELVVHDGVTVRAAVAGDVAALLLSMATGGGGGTGFGHCHSTTAPSASSAPTNQPRRGTRQRVSGEASTSDAARFTAFSPICARSCA